MTRLEMAREVNKRRNFLSKEVAWADGYECCQYDLTKYIADIFDKLLIEHNKGKISFKQELKMLQTLCVQISKMGDLIERDQ